MVHKRVIAIAPILIFLLLAGAACQHNVNSNAKTPAQQTAVYNSALAQANRALASGVISLQKSSVVSAEQTRTVLQYCDLVANTSEAIRIAMVNGSDWPATAAQIQKVLANVNTQRWLASAKITDQQTLALVSAVSSTITLIAQEVK